MSGAVIAIGIQRSGSLNVEASRESLSGSKYGAGSVSTSFVYATPIGGTAPYTYLWTFVGPDDGVVIQGETNSGARLQKTFAVAPGSSSVTIKCTVTDAFGATGDTPDISATLNCL